MRKLVCSFIVIVLIVGCSPDRKEKITIGVVLPLTGDAAVYGIAIKNGIDLAYSESIIKDKIQIVYKDDKGSATSGVNAFSQLIDINNADVVIGGGMSSVAAALAPISKQRKVVLLSPTATLPSLSNAGEYFFRIWPSDTYDGKVVGDFAVNKLNARRIATLYINLDYGVGINNVFKKTVLEKGIEVVFDEGYAQGTTDFRTQLQKIKEIQPDILFLPGYYQEIVNILKQMNDLKMDLTILGVNSMHDDRLIDAAGVLAENIIFSYPTFDENSDDKLISSFRNKYKARFDEMPNAFSAQGYDSYKVLENVFKSNLSINELVQDTTIINSLLRIQEYNGVSGKFSFDKNGDVEKKLQLITILDGRFTNYH